MLKKIWGRDLVRYCFIGGLSYMIELSALLGLWQLGLQRTAATAIAFWVGFVISFVLQKLLAFKDYNKEVKVILRQTLGFSLLVVFNYLFTLLVVSLFPDKYLVESRTLALVITTTWNYFLYKHLLFTTKNIKTPGLEASLEQNIEKLGHHISSRITRTLNCLNHRSWQRALTIFSFIVLLVSSTYAVTQATRVQSVTSDQFISTYNFADADKGEPQVAIDHTNIIKVPILWIQGKLPYNTTSLVVVNVLFVLASFLLWAYLIKLLLGSRIVAVVNLTFSAIIINSTAFAINLSMTTIRHIEYALALLFIISVSRLLKRHTHYLLYSILLSLFLALLILHDRFFLYVLVPAGIFTLLWSAAQRKVAKKQLLICLLVFGLGSVLSIFIAKLITFLGLTKVVYGYTAGLHFIPFEAVPGAILLSINQTIQLFGGFFFGSPIRAGYAGLLMCATVFIVSIVGMVLLAKEKKSPAQDFTYKYLVFSVIFCYLAYILPNLVSEGNARYLTFLVYIGITFFAWYMTNSSVAYRWLYPLTYIGLLLTLLFGVHHTTDFYANSLLSTSKNISYIQHISYELEQQGVTAIVSNGGYQAVRFYSNGHLGEVAELYGDCVTPLPWMGNESWSQPSNSKKTAFLIDQAAPKNSLAQDPCSPDKVKQIYGEPSKILVATSGVYKKDSKIYLYIYDYDIRTKTSHS